MKDHNYQKISLLLIFIILMCITTVSASEWQINSNKYVGNVTLNDDGTGSINVDKYGSADFNWNAVDGKENQFEAHYWFYTIPFTYHKDTDTITSSSTSATLVR